MKKTSSTNCSQRTLLAKDLGNIIVIYMIAGVVFIGQHNDARMNLAIALTAVRHGASVANHMEVVSLLKKKGKRQRLCPQLTILGRMQFKGTATSQ